MRKSSKGKGSGKLLVIVIGCCAGVLIVGIAAILVLNDIQKSEKITTASVSSTAEATVFESEKDHIAVSTAHLAVYTPEPDPEAEYAEQALLIKTRMTMLDGVSVGGVDVSGLTKEQALEKVSAELSEKTAAPSFVLMHNGKPYELPEKEDDEEIDPDFAGEVDEPVALGVSVDFDSAVEEAFNLLREGESNIGIVEEAAEIGHNGYDVPLSFKLDKEDVGLYVASIAEDLDTAPINASVRSENKQLIYTDSQVGYGVDREALTNAIMSIDPTENVPIDIPMKELDPLLTQEMLQSQYVLRGSYSTSFSGSTGNRKFNIRKGADLINGTILQPGDVFSTNATLGVRTKANGWKTAGAYESGQVVQQAGGGVCQLSGTLYNTAVMSDLEIVERKNHSMPVHYLDKGRDATINSVGNIIDFKFKNNTSSPIIIIGYTDGNTLHFEIYGEPMGNGEYDSIKIRTKQTGATKIKKVVTEDHTKPVGYEETVTSGSTGYTYESYKEYWKDGKKLKTEFLASSSYKMFPKEVIVGTKEEAPVNTESPKATEAPEKTTAPKEDPVPEKTSKTETPVETPRPETQPDESSQSGDHQPEEKPQEKPEEKQEEKPQEKPEEKQEEKPQEKPEEKPQEKPEEKPQEKPQPEPEERSSGSEGGNDGE